MPNNLNTLEKFTTAFRELPDASKRKIYSALTQVMAEQDAFLKETLIDQLEADVQGDFWDTLTETQRQRLLQSLKEADEGKTIAHETVMNEAKS
jgi:hypothetical protein